VAIIVEFVAGLMAGFWVGYKNGPGITNDFQKYEELLTNTLNSWGIYITMAVQVICIAILVPMYAKDNKRFNVVHVKINPVAYFLVFLLGMSAAMFLNGALIMSGIYALLQDSYSNTSDVLYSDNVYLTYLTAVILAPVMEEVMFRGLIYKKLRTYCIFSLAALLSAIYFGVYHMNYLQFLYATALGMFLAYAFERFKSVKASILLHAGANLTSVVLSTNAKVGNFVFGTEQQLIAATFLALVLLFGSVLIINAMAKKALVVQE